MLAHAMEQIYLICSIAQKMPELREIVVSSLHLERKAPWAVQMMAAPRPNTPLAK